MQLASYIVFARSTAVSYRVTPRAYRKTEIGEGVASKIEKKIGRTDTFPKNFPDICEETIVNFSNSCVGGFLSRFEEVESLGSY